MHKRERAAACCDLMFNTFSPTFNSVILFILELVSCALYKHAGGESYVLHFLCFRVFASGNDPDIVYTW